MPTQNQIVAQMTQGLAVTLPTLDTTIGSPVRQILDVLAEELSELTADQYLLSYQYDINNMTGSNLDAFVGLFGMTRFPAKRSVGFITLSRMTGISTDLTFAAGTQFSTVGSPPIVFSSLFPVTIVATATSVTVPVQAAVAGTSGNVSANTITQGIGGQLSSISTITNVSALTGGADPESDDQLISRFKKTVFRALTGTQAMYLASALGDPNVTQANVIGADEVFTEQIALSSGVGISSVQNLAYFYPNTAYFGPDLFTGDVLSPGVQYSITSELIPNPAAPTLAHTTGGSGTLVGGTYTYALVFTNLAGTTAIGTGVSITFAGGSTSNVVLTWTNPGAGLDFASTKVYKLSSGVFKLLATVNSPTATYTDTGVAVPSGAPPVVNTTGAPIIRSLDSINVPDGIYELQYNYLSNASRNDPVNGITNRIDIVANGLRPIEALQNLVYSSAYIFNVTDSVSIETDPFSMNIALFQRLDGTSPVPGNFFTPLAFNPIIEMATGLQGEPISPDPIHGTTWTENSNYWIVKDISPFGLGPNSRSGIEWAAPGPNWHTDNLTLTGTTPQALTVSNVNTNSIVVTNVGGSTTYTLTTDYVVSTTSGVTSIARAASGSTITNPEAVVVTYSFNDLALSVDYTYNQIPQSIQTAVQTWRLVTTDTMVHQCQELLLDMFFSYIGSAAPSIVLPQVEAAVSNYVSSLSFNGIIQVSEVLSTVQQVPGITAVRLLNSGDSSLVLYGTGSRNGQTAASYYAIQSVNAVSNGVVHTYATTSGTPLRALDVYLSDNTLATLNNVYLVQQGQNTFGSV